MTTSRLLLTAWDFDPSVIAGCALLLGLYFWRVRSTTPGRRLSYILGIVILFVSLESPLDTLSDTYLFSAHMAQHLFLILIVPPLMLFGIPESEARTWLRCAPARRIEQIVGRPVVAWFIGIVTMTVWHIPALYDLAVANETIHIFEHLSFLVTATIFWWPVLSPIPEKRLAPIAAIFYLFAAVAENSALGIVITFLPVGIYHAYLHPADPLGALSLIRNQWGLTTAVDQRLGGLFMWIPGCSVYFIVILLIYIAWADASGDTQLPPASLPHGKAA